ncbi:hypothetical protein Ssi03_15700 [Sphaerisporangium siamense]|uniref:Uncharacterized protein n=1 Tax=Sphaerisporangium siamense TaxID=795645 RepID=A0A7W7DBP3_9ACTN|nr:hypothetical protein [Sphaerisporangium siamense]GII83580.1 hypothetical protein Ssi03_15700 [Sphaerisporangium siamense]
MRLGDLDEYADLRLTQWAHMLGFRGHLSTWSHHYSTTMGTIHVDLYGHLVREASERARTAPGNAFATALQLT